MEEFLRDLDDEKTLLKVQEECRPGPNRTRRLDSDTVWDSLEAHFNLDGSSRAKMKEQGCTTDLKCLRDEVIRHLDEFDEPMLKSLRKIVAAMNLPPYNSLKDWFTPINNAAKKRWGEDDERTLLFKKHMKSPEGQHRIAVDEANEGVYKRNAKQLNVSYPDAMKIVHKWIGSSDWEDRLLAVMGATGSEKNGGARPADQVHRGAARGPRQAVLDQANWCSQGQVCQGG